MQGVDQACKLAEGTQRLQNIVLKPLQQEIIKTARNCDVLVNLPTGYGKSMLYQYPMINSNKTTVVFVPLRALLWDAISEAKRFGLSACEFTEEAFDQCFSAVPPKLLFLTPEKLFLGRGVLDVLEALVKFGRVERFVIDEAHCVCEWGSDFRPHYAQLSELKKLFPSIKILAMTATAPPDMRKELISGLLLQNCKVFYASYNRPNLRYSVKKVEKKDLCDQIVEIIGQNKNQAGIVYCQTIALCEQLFKKVRALCAACEIFHSKVPEKKREVTLNKFQRDQVKIIFATICFGMGINKPNVRFVVHAGASLNCENYYQESGRGGRDGLPAECIVLFYEGQQVALSYLIDKSSGRRLKMMRFRQLDKMLKYAKQTKECRKSMMFRILGEEFTKEKCKGSCDVCQNEENQKNVEKQDVTTEWLPVLQELSNIHCEPTKKQLIDILKGRSIKKGKYFSNLVGRMKKLSESEIRSVIGWFEEEGLLTTAPKKTGKWKVLVLRVDKRQLKATKKITIPVFSRTTKSEVKGSTVSRFNKYLEEKNVDVKEKQNRPSLLEKYGVVGGISFEDDLVVAKVIENEPYELDLSFLEYEQAGSLAGDDDPDNQCQQSFVAVEEFNELPEPTYIPPQDDPDVIPPLNTFSQENLLKLLDKITDEDNNQRDQRDLKRSVFEKQPGNITLPKQTPSFGQIGLDEVIKKKWQVPIPSGTNEQAPVEKKVGKQKKYDLWK